MKKGEGIIGQIGNNPQYTGRLTEKDLKDFIKSMDFNHKSSPLIMIWGPEFAAAYRNEFGDDQFYLLVTSKNVEIQCDEKTYDYIMDFVKWYELKQSQKHNKK